MSSCRTTHQKGTSPRSDKGNSEFDVSAIVSDGTLEEDQRISLALQAELERARGRLGQAKADVAAPLAAGGQSLSHLCAHNRSAFFRPRSLAVKYANRMLACSTYRFATSHA